MMTITTKFDVGETAYTLNTNGDIVEVEITGMDIGVSDKGSVSVSYLINKYVKGKMSCDEYRLFPSPVELANALVEKFKSNPAYDDEDCGEG